MMSSELLNSSASYLAFLLSMNYNYILDYQLSNYQYNIMHVVQSFLFVILLNFTYKLKSIIQFLVSVLSNRCQNICHSFNSISTLWSNRNSKLV